MTSLTRKSILVIFNPTAGAKSIEKLTCIIEELKGLGIEVKMSETSYAGHAQEIAERATEENYDLVVAAGGDGTMNEVINGIYPGKVAIAFIPLGTVNVLALEIGLENSIPSIVQYLANGRPKPCFLGNSNGRYFLLMMSVGHDAKAVAFVNRTLKASIGKLAYAISYLKSLIVSKILVYKVVIDEKAFSCYNVIISNGRLYGGDFVCAPNADLEDNHLVISMTQKGGWVSAIKYAVLMFLGKYPNSPYVKTITAQKCYVECLDSQEPIQLDGDAIGELPAYVSISEDYIQLLRP